MNTAETNIFRFSILPPSSIFFLFDSISVFLILSLAFPDVKPLAASAGKQVGLQAGGRKKEDDLKVYISADIEGTTGIAHMDETTKSKSDYADFQKQMTAEVVAACEGAVEAGAKEILVKDAHDSARNIIQAQLPECARLIREWSGHPYSMMQGLDKTFDAVMMTGYHSRAGSDTNPLAHTFTGGVAYIKINGRYASEFLINAYTAALNGVPVVMVTGDKGLCDDATGIIPNIATVAVSEGIGASSVSIHPNIALRKIKEAALGALSGNLASCKIALPAKFEIEIMYKDYKRAYRASFYPGVTLIEPHITRYESDDYFEVLRMLMFTW
jgi:D-amino peptidase